jgi:hypothetical protein
LIHEGSSSPPRPDDVTRRTASRTSQNPDARWWNRTPLQDRLEKSNARLTYRGDNLPAADHDDGTLGASVTRDNILYLIIGALVIVTAVLSYQLYQDHKQPEGMRIDLGPNGLSIEKK